MPTSLSRPFLRRPAAVLALAFALFAAPAAGADEAADLAAARALFTRNLEAIRARDADAYLACYLRSPRLVRTGIEGFELGFDGLAASVGEAWPDALHAREVRLSWIRDGVVYGTYRYRVVYGDEAVEGLSERLFLRTPDGWRIGVTTAFAAPPGTAPPSLALVGARVYDGTDAEPIDDATVLVVAGRIAAVGPRAKVEVPEGMTVVDLAGRFVTPGLVDTHVHYSQSGWVDARPDAVDVRDTDPYPQVVAELERHPERFHRAFLHAGVTAVFDVGGYPWTRRLGADAEDDPWAPHVVATGPLLATLDPGLSLPDQTQFVRLADDATIRATVRSHAASGSAAIKVWFIVTPTAPFEDLAHRVRVAGLAARDVGLPLVVHATDLEAARVAVEAGARLLVHSVDDALVDERFVSAVLARGVAYCPTLTVVDGYTQVLTRTVWPETEAALDHVHPSVAARVRRTPDLPPTGFEMDEERLAIRTQRVAHRMATNLRVLHEAGAQVVLGTDAGNPLTLHGPAVFRELEAMQAAGLSPRAVLTAATHHAADAIGRGDDLGTLTPGAIADLLVLGADPGRDIAHLREIEGVMRAGVLHAREVLRPR